MPLRHGGSELISDGTQGKFGIRDALVLTTGAAIACVLMCRIVPPGTWPISGYEFGFCISSVLLALTYALALLVLIGERPLREKSRSPGKLCVILVAVASLLPSLSNWHELWFSGGSLDTRLLNFFMFNLLDSDAYFPAIATVSGWFTLWLTGTSRRSTDWLDIAGTFIGIAWIGFALTFDTFYFYKNEILAVMGVTMG